MQSSQQARETNLVMMTEFDALDQITTYMAENRLQAALEAKILHMDVEANEIEVFEVGDRINVGP